MKKAQKNADQGESAQNSGLPLFFVKPAAIDANRHATAGVHTDLPPRFAAKTNSLPLNVAEFVEAAKYYPIVFTGDETPMPMVVVGLENENYYVGKDGAWETNTYIPAYVRKYPFAFTEVPEAKQLVLCIDEGAEHFAEKAGGKGTRALYEDGKPSELAQNALEFCTAYHNHHLLTRNFCEALKKADLLVPNQTNAELYNGRKMNLSGFNMIDQEKFEKLSDEKFAELRKGGWLALIYFVFLSSTNWKNLVDRAAVREKKAAN